MTLFIIVLTLLTNSILFPQNSPTQGTEINERLGNQIPPNIAFFNENGDTVLFGELINKPTVLTLVYYNCPGICTPLLYGLVEMIQASEMIPGKDYHLVTVSFNELEKPDLALAKKKSYLRLFKKDIDAVAWNWLTGDNRNIQKLTRTVGFNYIPSGKDFVHRAALFFLNSNGEVVRYLYGTEFNKIDFEMAVREASENSLSNMIWKYCFSYNEIYRTYSFNSSKVFGSLIIFSIILFSTVFISIHHFKK
ncbi:MAG: SCO family protein [Candidatus Hodarchaeales archaeon]|jgi:protein SCO1/2